MEQQSYTQKDVETAFQIQKVYGDMQSQGLSARTVRYAHNILSSSLKQAVKWKMINQNPCELCELPRMGKTEMMYFTPEETVSFLNTAKANRWFPLFLLAIETGMRPEEYLGLQWKDVDFENKTLSVRRAVNKTIGGRFIFVEPKTKRSSRGIPISNSCLTA